MDEEQKMRYIGCLLKDIMASRDILFYLAFYCHFDKAFYLIHDKEPELPLK